MIPDAYIWILAAGLGISLLGGVIGFLLNISVKRGKGHGRKLTDLSRKERLRQLELQEKEEEQQLRERKQAEIRKIQEREESFQSELAQKEAELRDRQVLARELDEGAKEVEEEEESPASLLVHLKLGVRKTREQLLSGLSDVIHGKRVIDAEALDELEEVLIGADIGPETTDRILLAITEKSERNELKNIDALQSAIKEEIRNILSKDYVRKGNEDAKPLVLLCVGVNGVGKTTTIGKLAAQYERQGKKVLLGAGDTFRAAAIEQLQQWAERAGCDIVSKTAGSDPSSVMYETISRAIAEDYDVVICDTAGRLHTKKNLMEELKKMARVLRKHIPEAPHQVLLVLDATTGQNAIFQTREFLEATDLTGLVVTKLDGTAKGGVIIGIVNEFEVPVQYIGIGEKIKDLRPFDAQAFADSLFE